MKGLNKKALAYGKKLIREGKYNVGSGLAPTSAATEHFLDSAATHQFVGPLEGVDTVFQASLHAIVDAAPEDDVLDAAEDLLSRIEKALEALDGVGDTPSADTDGPYGGEKPPPDQGTSADLSQAQIRELWEKIPDENARVDRGAWTALAGSNVDLYRSMTFHRAAVDKDERTVEVVFSSTEPFERYFGIEVLGHKPGEVDLSRLNSGGAVLVDHEGDQVGVVVRAWIDSNEKGRAILKFSRGERGDLVFTDIADGIRQLVSVGYFVNSVREIPNPSGDGPPTFYVDDWTAFEVSIVKVPVDFKNAGVGRKRSLGEGPAGADPESRSSSPTQTVKTKAQKKGLNMDDDDDDENDKNVDLKNVSTPDPTLSEAEAKERAAKAQKKGLEEGRENERKRFAELTDFAELQAKEGRPIPADIMGRAMAEGDDVGKLAKRAHDWRAENQELANRSAIPQEDADKFSLYRLSRAMLAPGDAALQKAAGFEFEMCSAEGERRGANPQGVSIPDNIWMRDLVALRERQVLMGRRDVNISTDSAGGFLKHTEHGAFIELLRNKSFALKWATILSGLRGDLAFDRQTGAATPGWVGEGEDVPESQQTYGQLIMTPKTLGVSSDITRKAQLQSTPSLEALTRNDILNVTGLEIDRVVIEGSGTANQPLGILNHTNALHGIGVLSINAAITWPKIPLLWGKIAYGNADMGRMGFMTSVNLTADMMGIERASGTGNFILNKVDDGLIGFPLAATNQVDTDYGDGSQTALILGDWSQALVGFWGGMSLLADPYTLGKSGGLRLTVMHDVDVGLRVPAAFAYSSDINCTAL